MHNRKEIFAGYDPGGNGNHGFALLTVEKGRPVNIETSTHPDAESIITQVENNRNDIIGLGVDTLSCWCTGHNGDRPADQWLRLQYPAVSNSIASPNSLYGSMSINGMAVLIAAREINPNIIISETHPKVLYHALNDCNREYRYEDKIDKKTKKIIIPNQKSCMDNFLLKKLQLNVFNNPLPQEGLNNPLPQEGLNGHEWDAAISAYAVWKGISGDWTHDLHKIPTGNNCRIIPPCGQTFYYWPE